MTPQIEPRYFFASDVKKSQLYISGGLNDENYLGGSIECLECDENHANKIYKMQDRLKQKHKKKKKIVIFAEEDVTNGEEEEEEVYEEVNDLPPEITIGGYGVKFPEIIKRPVETWYRDAADKVGYNDRKMKENGMGDWKRNEFISFIPVPMNDNS